MTKGWWAVAVVALVVVALVVAGAMVSLGGQASDQDASPVAAAADESSPDPNLPVGRWMDSAGPMYFSASVPTLDVTADGTWKLDQDACFDAHGTMTTPSEDEVDLEDVRVEPLTPNCGVGKSTHELAELLTDDDAEVTPDGLLFPLGGNQPATFVAYELVGSPATTETLTGTWSAGINWPDPAVFPPPTITFGPDGQFQSACVSGSWSVEDGVLSVPPNPARCANDNVMYVLDGSDLRILDPDRLYASGPQGVVTFIRVPAF